MQSGHGKLFPCRTRRSRRGAPRVSCLWTSNFGLQSVNAEPHSINGKPVILTLPKTILIFSTKLVHALENSLCVISSSEQLPELDQGGCGNIHVFRWCICWSMWRLKTWMAVGCGAWCLHGCRPSMTSTPSDLGWTLDKIDLHGATTS